VSHRH